MKKEKLKYFLYSNVILEDVENHVFEGWFIPYGIGYMLLPNDDIWTIYLFQAIRIKSLTHKTNGVTMK